MAALPSPGTGPCADKALDVNQKNQDQKPDQATAPLSSQPAAPAQANAPERKKSRRSRRKRKGNAGGGAPPGANTGAGSGGSAVAKEPSSRPPHRGVKGFTDYYVRYGQSDVPSVPVAQLFAGKELPSGLVMRYEQDWNAHRADSEELRALDRAQSDLYDTLREAAEVHRQVRAHAHTLLRPGARLIDVCEELENMNRRLVGERGLERGIGFPTGCSLNHCAAHFSPNPGDTTVLTENDVCKIDFGTQINGRIIDSAFTVAFHEKFDPLLEASREACYAGLAFAGVDVALGELGGVVQEVLESYEVEIDGTTVPVKSIRNLCGHDIVPYSIHGGKHVPNVRSESRVRMEEGEVFAIECFASTGRGAITDDGECSHYMRAAGAPHVPLRLRRSKELLAHIDKTFATLPFCRRWLERPDGGSTFTNGPTGHAQTRYLGALKNLCDVGLLEAAPPLVDIPGSYTAQYEHTFILRPTCKEILSKGEDY